MIAAVALALGARRFSLRHRDGIAVMRCLGASKAQLGQMLWVEFLLLGLVASLAGSLIGYAVHEGLVIVVSNWLATGLPAARPLTALQGVVTGLLLLLGFAFPPLAAFPLVARALVVRPPVAQPAHTGR